MSSDYEERMIAGTTSPLRIITNIDEDIDPSGFINIHLDSTEFNLPSHYTAICTLRDISTYGVPFLTQCTYDSGSTSYKLINIDQTKIDSGRYLIEISFIQQNLFSEGVSLSLYTKIIKLTVSIAPQGTPSLIDSIGIVPAPSISFFLFSFIKLYRAF